MLAETLAFGIELYAVVGLVFATAFVVRGAPAVDGAARGSRWPLRLILLPGAVALWPYLAARRRRAVGASS